MAKIFLNRFDVVPCPEAVDSIGMAQIVESKFSHPQQIISYYTRHGFQFDGSSHWTQKHLNWVERLQFKNSIHQEVLREYLTVFYDLSEKVHCLSPVKAE